MQERVHRLIDLLLAGLVAPLALPLIAVLAVVVVLDTGRAPWFRQERVGKHGKLFTIVKLETFREHPSTFSRSEEIGRDDPRLTRTGGFLRRYKLDELPQLFNVLKGDMSFIGPRPDLPSQAVDYDGVAMDRLEVRPGLTGLVQVSGNSALTWEQRFVLDSWYVRNRSLWLNARIVAATLPAIAKGEAADHDPLSVHWLLPRDLSDSTEVRCKVTSR